MDNCRDGQTGKFVLHPAHSFEHATAGTADQQPFTRNGAAATGDAGHIGNANEVIKLLPFGQLGDTTRAHARDFARACGAVEQRAAHGIHRDNLGFAPHPAQIVATPARGARAGTGDEKHIDLPAKRCVDLGDDFLWLDEIRADFSKARTAKPTLLGIESLLALKQACENQNLDSTDIEEIFCLAARRLLDLPLPREMPDVNAAYQNAKEIIPGGTQLLSKRPEMFAPDQWPAYYREARGCEVIDISGRRFIDMSLNGILSTILGSSDPDVNAAVI